MLERGLGVLCFIVAVALLPFVPGGALVLRWGSMAAAMPLLLFLVRVRFTPAHWVGLAFYLFAVLSLAWAPLFYDGMAILAQFTILAGMFCLGAEARSLRASYIGFSLGITVSAVLAVWQKHGFTYLPQTESPSGLFVNKNALGEIAAMVLVGAVLSSRTWVQRISLGIGPVVAVLYAGSRASWCGLAVAGVIWAGARHRWLAPFAVLFFIGGALTIATEPGSTDTLIQRLGATMDMARHMQWWGDGVGSFYALYPKFAQSISPLTLRFDHAHDDIFELFFEFGPAALLYLGLVGYAVLGAHETERLVLVVFLVEGFFGFPLYMPATGCLGALAAGRAVRTRYDLRRAVGTSGTAGGARLARAAYVHDRPD